MWKAIFPSHTISSLPREMAMASNRFQPYVVGIYIIRFSLKEDAYYRPIVLTAASDVLAKVVLKEIWTNYAASPKFTSISDFSGLH